eukprot:TRINITY_DN193_c0_g2_i2.p1 TRINITY_DN193_c0_g2~~TRINITY_DN193_c0_g2_i2.p1  ORF type:complete len:487 (+),score=183.84 TRINITY_DN193_c0_g2_i2:1-1461(+)
MRPISIFCDQILVEMNALQELVAFCADPKAHVRLQAVKHVLDLSATEEGVALLASVDITKSLCRLVGDLELIAKDALLALINMSTSLPQCERMIELNLIDKLMENIMNKGYKFVNLNVMLLANVSKSENGSKKILQSDSRLTGFHVRMLIKFFLDSAPAHLSRSTRPIDTMQQALGQMQLNGDDDDIPELEEEKTPSNDATAEGDEDSEDEEEKKSTTEVIQNVEETLKAEDTFQFVANILTNISQLTEGQTLLMNPERKILVSVLSELNSCNVIRRRGIASCLRNCCFNEEYREHFLSKDLNLVESILWPLMGPETLTDDEKKELSPTLLRFGPFKRREQDPVVRRLLVEVIGFLTGFREGREMLRGMGIYYVLRELHKVIESIGHENTPDEEQTCEKINQLVQVIHLDEDPTPEELEQKRIEYEKRKAEQKRRAMIEEAKITSFRMPTGVEFDYDDLDDNESVGDEDAETDDEDSDDSDMPDML